MGFNITSTSSYLEESVSNEIDETFLSYHQWQIFNIVNFVCLNTVIGLFGIISNIINIVVFIKQGFSNTVNISFLGLAISDLFCVVGEEWVCIWVNPAWSTRHGNSDLAWVVPEYFILIGAWLHVVCGRITSYITVYITAERCLCTILPLKVKKIITPEKTTVVVLLIYFFNILCIIPEYATSFLEWKFFPDTNRTILSVMYTSEREKFETLSFALCSIGGFVSFVAVIVFTTVLVVKLKQSSEWRKKVTSRSDQTGSMSNRDKKIVKMIVLIATVLIVCYTPGTILSVATVCEPEFVIGRKFSNIANSMWSLAFVFQTTNASVNIFLYYKMSSKYREAFHKIFKRCQ